ncbi:MAG: hypothetical protein IKD72_03760, partial [Clostridia bacterium]|nr:hypothetical protein [Clostridia bacterium]
MTEKLRAVLFRIFKEDSAIGRLIDRFVTREIITYLVFGVLTTAVNLITFYITKKIFIAVGWEGVLNSLLDSAGFEKALALLGK